MTTKQAKKRSQPAASPDELAALLGHSFTQPELLILALTHSSIAAERAAGKPRKNPSSDNEQLEFVGDAVLGLIVAESLYRRFPALTEGELTRIRALIVSRSHLATVAARLDLGRFLHLGRGEESSGGRHKPAILSNTLEAVLAAAYLDGGLDVARPFAEIHIIDPGLAPFQNDLHEGKTFGSDYKSALQELVQSLNQGKLQYIVLSESGPDHSKHFNIQAQLLHPDGSINPLAQSEGRTKKEAQQAAARIAYEKLLAAQPPEGENETME